MKAVKIAVAILAAASMNGCVSFYEKASNDCESERPKSEFTRCMKEKGAIQWSDEDLACIDAVEQGDFKTEKDCRYAYRNPEKWECKQKGSKEEREHCLWALENPIEAKCEEEAKKHGGYWDCIRIERELEANAKDREERETVRHEAARAAEKKRQREAVSGVLDALSDHGKREIEVRQKQIDAQKRTKCVTKRGIGKELVTECEESH